MFFVTLLLNAVLAWMRGQSGTTQPARAALHGRDLRLLPADRQAAVQEAAADAAQAGARLRRSACCWRRRTRSTSTTRASPTPAPGSSAACRPSATSSACSTGSRAPRARADSTAAQLEKLISALGNRVFLMNNVHENAPVVFQTRWTMSYLRGPLSRPQIASLMAPLKAALPAPAAAAAAAPPLRRSPAPAAAGAAVAAAAPRRVSPPRRRPRSRAASRPAYLPLRGAAPAGASLAYVPMLIGVARVRLLDTKSAGRRVDRERAPGGVRRRPDRDRLDEAADLAVAVADLESTPREGASFHDLPAPARDAKALRALVEGLRRLAVPDPDRARSSAARRRSSSRTSGESEADFRARLAQGVARGPRHAGRRAAREVRRQGRGAAVEAAHGAAGGRPRGEPGARRRPADRRLGRRLDPRRLPRAQVGLGRLDHERRARRGPRRAAARRRQAGRGERHAPAGPARRPAGLVRAGRGGRGRRRRGHRAARLRR